MPLAVMDANTAPSAKRAAASSAKSEEGGVSLKRIKEVNQQQRDLRELIEANKETLDDPASSAVDEVVQRVTNTFKNASTVKHLVNDSELMLDISHSVQVQASKIGKAHAPITLAGFKTALRALFGSSSQINWVKMGRELRVYGSSVPEFDVMLGPVDVVPPPKVEKVKEPKAPKVHHEQEKPQDLVAAKSASTASSSAAADTKVDGFEMLKKVENEVKHKLKQQTLVDAEDYKKGSKAPVGAFDLLVDPKSFAQTVENIFAYSFLVKDGWASLKVGEDGTPVAASTIRPDGGVKETQAILTFTMDDWQRISEEFAIEKGMLKHRTQGYEDEKKHA